MRGAEVETEEMILAEDAMINISKSEVQRRQE